MKEITQSIMDELYSYGADLVGIGDLAELPPEVRENLPVGICVAVKYPKDVIRGIYDLPTREYYDQYNLMNDRLDMLVTRGAELIKELGFEAIPQTRAYVNQYATDYSSLLPHKTIATRAGIGWIGKSALLVTKQFGSMIRISSILTNAPLETAMPINESKCGECNICTNACPGGAISGKSWSVITPRDEFFDARLCRATARQRSLEGFGVEISQCGKCIYVCPYTQRYLNAE